jgi:hypothetical protein
MAKWVITQTTKEECDCFSKKTVLYNFTDEKTALEEYRSMYMNEILKRNVFNSFDWDIELEYYSDDIIAAIQHTPKKTYLCTNSECWTFESDSNKKIHQDFLQFVQDSRAPKR